MISLSFAAGRSSECVAPGSRRFSLMERMHEEAMVPRFQTFAASFHQAGSGRATN